MRRAVELHDGATVGKYHALPDPLELPGGMSLCAAEFPEAFRDSTAPVYGHLVETGRLYHGAAGFLANSFYELKQAVVQDSKKVAKKGTFPPAYPVGPFVRSSSDEPGESACLEWLDLQPTGSVVYVSFGSTGHAVRRADTRAHRRAGDERPKVPLGYSTRQLSRGRGEGYSVTFGSSGFVSSVVDYWCPVVGGP
uniref:Uncharacterized protein n=1 Tax=Oryza punctata TaxID=4537 RepID=A0A0E0JXV5_ORYPU